MISTYIQNNPLLSLAEARQYSNQLIFEYNSSHDDTIDISPQTIAKLYYEIRPKIKLSENELIKKLLEKYNSTDYYITQYYSSSDDTNYYFFGLPAFIKRAKTCNHLFIDGTFRIVPIKLANGQLLNLLVYDEATNLYLPFLHVLMTGRSSLNYDTVFNLMITCPLISISLGKYKIITSDFENALMKSIKSKVNDETTVTGCIFHYIAALVKNFKKLCDENDVCAKSLLKLLCACPFVPIEVFEIICKKLDAIKEINDFAKYFLNTWGKKYDVINKLKVSDMIFSNNGVESFNKVLNSHIAFPHPTIYHMIYILLKVDKVYFHRYARQQNDNFDHKKSYFIPLTRIQQELDVFTSNFGLERAEIPSEIIKKHKKSFRFGEADYRDIEIEKYLNKNDEQFSNSVTIKLEESDDININEFEITEDDIFGNEIN
ncbi:hypothetical protein TVAG_507810 [Trichomonas vaginalis G3]|uniref:MULE transposase domain-containing protein n=3 Tax=Trichomonas vaginalis (strain ATCC PRA-98 / G3) TaxID=412133 RepID=A2H7M2_TRIV3|nr:hypothetical protein TVAGG3_0636320 [Trichomonas vaginalis G3]EAX74595.1 hypothetical protein TVAG_507810 [Trichomonas vaginalis G3]KAI5504873.1 hypothetical protein TVAGG3_0636320 [Trichomonas vaginalis G3]|eukprot:XP_001287525.1 hypothetical protein [Trichomonas vaginalis G3]